MSVLEWNLEWGPHLKTLEQAWDQLGKVPPAIETMPELHEYLQYVWHAFVELDKSRQYGFGHPQPITIAEIEAYARLNKLSEEDTHEMTRHVRCLDQKYLEYQIKKAERDKSKSRN